MQRLSRAIDSPRRSVREILAEIKLMTGVYGYLEADPLEKIENTKRTAAVVLGGKLFGRQQIDVMLSAAEKIANEESIAKFLLRTEEKQGVSWFEGYFILLLP